MGVGPKINKGTTTITTTIRTNRSNRREKVAARKRIKTKTSNKPKGDRTVNTTFVLRLGSTTSDRTAVTTNSIKAYSWIMPVLS